MTNIDEIERLRADLFTARCEAEDMSGEIERLRGDADQLHIVVKEQAQEVQRLRKYTDGVRCPACDTTRLELGENRAEIERLRVEVATWERACASYVNVLAARDAEIKALRDTLPPLIEDNERLRRENEDLNAGWQRTYDHDCNLMKAEIERLNGTVRRLWDEDRRETGPSP